MYRTASAREPVTIPGTLEQTGAASFVLRGPRVSWRDAVDAQQAIETWRPELAGRVVVDVKR